MIHKTQQDYSLFSLGVLNLPLGSVTDLLLFLDDVSGKHPVIKTFHLILLMLFVVLTACECYIFYRFDTSKVNLLYGLCGWHTAHRMAPPSKSCF